MKKKLTKIDKRTVGVSDNFRGAFREVICATEVSPPGDESRHLLIAKPPITFRV